MFMFNERSLHEYKQDMIFMKLPWNATLFFDRIFLYCKILFPFKKAKIFPHCIGIKNSCIEPEHRKLNKQVHYGMSNKNANL